MHPDAFLTFGHIIVLRNIWNSPDIFYNKKKAVAILLNESGECYKDTRKVLEACTGSIPPHLIPLVEVIAGEHSSQEVLQIVCDVADSLHQKPVRVYKDPTGFILNRLQ